MKEVQFDFAFIDAVANEMADAARKVILPYFRAADLQQENKLATGFDPVTEADRAAERAMRGILKRKCPADGILGEEYGAHEGSSGLIWVLDPIDGTRGFVSGTPTWGVLIAVSDSDGPRYGLIDQPYISERFMGYGDQAFMKGPQGETILRTKTTRSLSEATIFTTFPEVGTVTEQTAFHRVAQKTKLTRYGMDCYAYALLAAGQIDLVIEAQLQPYDIQAPIALIQAAGGIVTDWAGAPAHLGGRVIAAANAEIHTAALKILSTATK